MANRAVAVSQAAVELIAEDEGEENTEADMGEGSSTADLAPRHSPVPWASMPMVHGFWVLGPSIQAVGGGGPPA